jgi:hypothetical protein
VKSVIYKRIIVSLEKRERGGGMCLLQNLAGWHGVPVISKI